jgi:hypothetical protein
LNWLWFHGLASYHGGSTSDHWRWENPELTTTAPTWGGNLEVLHWNLATGRWIAPRVLGPMSDSAIGRVLRTCSCQFLSHGPLTAEQG